MIFQKIRHIDKSRARTFTAQRGMGAACLLLVLPVSAWADLPTQNDIPSLLFGLGAIVAFGLGFNSGRQP